MPIENLRSYCLAKATVAESFPFDEHSRKNVCIVQFRKTSIAGKFEV
jgi:hypothetical protein